MLTAKYCSKANCLSRLNGVATPSERGGGRFENVTEHLKAVCARDRNTEFETPYWAGGSLISDLDLLRLLCSGQTDNHELQKCYISFCPSHPQVYFNGMTYVSPRANNIAPSEIPFLGHI